MDAMIPRYPELMEDNIWTDIMKSTNDKATESWMPHIKPKNHVTIIALEGTHGIGKSTILNELHEKGYFILPELFNNHEAEIENVIEEDANPTKLMDRHSKYPLKNYHIFAKEIKWTGAQFDELADLGEEWKRGLIEFKDNLIFIDRSYLTPMIYGRLTQVNYFLFANICREMVRFLESEYAFYYKIVRIDRLLENEIDDQMTVIRKRAEKEPWRVELNELSDTWLWRCTLAYHQLDRVIDKLIILNRYGDHTPDYEADKVLRMIKPLTI